MVNPWKVIINNTRIVQMAVPPWPVNEPMRTMNITGYLLPWEKGHVVFANMPGTTDSFVLVFSTKEKLITTMTMAKIPYDSIKRIDDQKEFLASFKGSRVRVAADPYFTERGTVRFTEIFV